jgi:hypothetical protein
MIMDVENKKKKNALDNENGQAIFEFLFFFPTIILLIFLIVSLGNSINGSINQQKVTRSYLYARLKNTSMYPQKDPDDQIYQNWKIFGMFFIGWKEKFAEGTESPLQPCYKVQLPFADTESKCDTYKKETSSFIRVGTVYGLCGATYYNNGTEIVRGPASNDPGEVSDKNACTIISQ